MDVTAPAAHSSPFNTPPRGRKHMGYIPGENSKKPDNIPTMYNTPTSRQHHIVIENISENELPRHLRSESTVEAIPQTKRRWGSKPILNEIDEDSPDPQIQSATKTDKNIPHITVLRSTNVHASNNTSVFSINAADMARQQQPQSGARSEIDARSEQDTPRQLNVVNLPSDVIQDTHRRQLTSSNIVQPNTVPSTSTDAPIEGRHRNQKRHRHRRRSEGRGPPSDSSGPPPYTRREKRRLREYLV